MYSPITTYYQSDLYIHVDLYLQLLLCVTIAHVVRSKGSRMKDIMLKKLNSTTTASSSTHSSSSSAGHAHNSSNNKHKSSSSSSSGQIASSRSAEEEEEGTSKSLLLFLTHRRQELAIEIDRLQTHMQSTLTLNPPILTTPVNTDLSTPNTELTHIKWQVYTYMNHLSRMLYFGMNGYSDILNDTYTSYTTPTIGTGTGTIRYGLGQYLIYALRDKYGLDQVSKEIKRYITATMTSSSNSKYYSSASISESEVQELLSSIKYWKKEVCMKILRVMGGQNYDQSDMTKKHTHEMISYVDLFTPLTVHQPSAAVSSAGAEVSQSNSNTTTSTTQLSNSKKRKRMIPSFIDTATNIHNNNTSNSSSNINKVDEQTGLSSYLSSLPVKLEIGSGSGKHYTLVYNYTTYTL